MNTWSSSTNIIVATPEQLLWTGTTHKTFHVLYFILCSHRPFRGSHDNPAYRWADWAPVRPPSCNSWVTTAHPGLADFPTYEPSIVIHALHRKALKRNMMVNCQPDSLGQNGPPHGVDVFLAAAALHPSCLWSQHTKFSPSCVTCVRAECGRRSV